MLARPSTATHPNLDHKMATATAAAEYVLPEKYTDDLKDENGNPMSKRCGSGGCRPPLLVVEVPVGLANC